MRLSLYSDLSLRLLVYLARVERAELVSTTVVAKKYRVSAHHMRKVAQGLRKLGFVESVEGRGGGLRLAVDPEHLKVGNIVEALEGNGRLADCAGGTNTGGPCPLHGACLLKGALDRAERSFFEELNKFTIADVVRGPTVIRLEKLIKAA